MNRIEAQQGKCADIQREYLTIAIDGVPLDGLLDALNPEWKISGFIPSLLGWFHDPQDRYIPWERILPGVGCTGYAPILICPDDLDFVCTVIMAEVTTESLDVVQWDRLGFDVAKAGSVGSVIRWEPLMGQYTFDRNQYENCLAAFKEFSEQSPL